MCGRLAQYQLHRYPDLFEARQLTLALPPRYNVAPSVPLIACRADAEGRRELVALTWGFVPRWARAGGPRPINARAETLFTNALFRESARLRRCLVPADGFYEWRREGKLKQPYFVRPRSGEPFALAALWDNHGEEGGLAGNVVIVVTEPNDVVAPLHDRMPVILSPEDHALWLDRSVNDPARLHSLLRPFASEAMEAIKVSREVNKAGTEGPQLVEPVAEE